MNSEYDKVIEVLEDIIEFLNYESDNDINEDRRIAFKYANSYVEGKLDGVRQKVDDEDC